MPIAELSMGILAGIAASAHCVGMCGAFPLHLARSSTRSPVAARQILYIAGKTFTYAFLGALFGALGNALAESGLLPQSQKTLALVAGLAIILFGLGMVGVHLPSPLAGKLNAFEWGFVKQIYGHFFANPGAGSSFLLGMATGFLPCPITLAMLAVAAGSHSVVKGIVLLAGLGLGTAPALVAVGLFGNLVDARWRRIGLRPAGVIVLLLGALTIARTQEFMHRGCHAHATSAVACSCAECRRLGRMCSRCAAAKAAKGERPDRAPAHGRP
mgnify:CR=1 FL=1